MTYTPIDDADIKAPLAANNAVWTTLIDNDTEVWDAYEPGFECNPYPLATASAREFRFRVRGGDELIGAASAGMSIVVGVRAVSSGAAVPVDIKIGPYTYTSALSVTAVDWYDDSARSLLRGSGEPVEVVVASAATGGPTMNYWAIRCVVSAGSATGVVYASGYRNVPSFWYAANRAVPSDVVGRLINNPTAIAKSRPVCVAFHCVDTVRAVSTKSTDLWGVEDAPTFSVVGRMQVPYVDRQERTYVVDCYTNETVPRVTARIAAGSDAATLPQGTINVDSTTGFASSGTLVILTQDGAVNAVTYGGVTGTSFTTCSGGTSTLTLGDEVRQGGAEFSVKIGGNTETWANTGWHSWNVRLGGGTPQAVIAAINPGASNKAAIRTLQVWRTGDA